MEYENLFELMIDNVHQYYIDYFIKKTSDSMHEPLKIFEDIHKHIYLPSKIGNNLFLIKRTIIKDYFLGLSPNELTNLFMSF